MYKTTVSKENNEKAEVLNQFFTSVFTIEDKENMPTMEERHGGNGDCSLVRRFCSPKVRKTEIEGSSFRRFCSPKVRKSDDDFYSFLL